MWSEMTVGSMDVAQPSVILGNPLHRKLPRPPLYKMLRITGGMENFHYRNQIMCYDLHYRPTCGGNPGLAFTLADAAFRSSEEIESNAAFVLQLAQSTLSSTRLSLQGKKEFVGLGRSLHSRE
ncbi:hypothetical protein PILCRDRAFT_493188 [Piloderma croceum F 1598]|uniref:Uncharacterized protein n=1 Tax=Piloderma croceum (strain F 1598) TaxID=765440 RepID=A0A0C3BWX3_PILCF|nr:hypothetical protein PILCRDRAFT_493188 [Piloderma croceum F 1598]